MRAVLQRRSDPEYAADRHERAPRHSSIAKCGISRRNRCRRAQPILTASSSVTIASAGIVASVAPNPRSLERRSGSRAVPQPQWRASLSAMISRPSSAPNGRPQAPY